MSVRSDFSRVGAAYRRRRPHRHRQFLGLAHGPRRAPDRAGGEPGRGGLGAPQEHHRQPNCSTAQLVVGPQTPARPRRASKRVVVATYQSVSGAGKEGMDELWDQTKGVFVLGPSEPRVFPKQIAFNVIPCIGGFRDDGYTDEEAKLWNETQQDPRSRHRARRHLRSRAGDGRALRGGERGIPRAAR